MDEEQLLVEIAFTDQSASKCRAEMFTLKAYLLYCY